MDPLYEKLIIALVGLLVGGLSTFLLKITGIISKHRLEENSQLIQAYRDLLGSHQKQIDNLNECTHKLEEKAREQDHAHSVCRAENESLQREVARLMTQVEYLQVTKIVNAEGIIISADVACDIKGEITEWDASATVLFGWTRSEALGKSITLIMDESFVGRHQTSFDKIVLTHDKRPRHGILNGKARNKRGDVFDVAIVLSSWNEKNEKRFGATIRKVKAEV